MEWNSVRSEGLVVSKVAPDSNAHAVGFREGDQVLAINREVVQTPEQLAAKLRAAGRKTISVLRGDSKLRLTIG